VKHHLDLFEGLKPILGQIRNQKEAVATSHPTAGNRGE
jgi:hypothetical protein